MCEIVAKWIQHRLGLVIDMSPDSFGIKTASGCLLAQILHSYQIIVAEQLNFIVESDLIKQCYENFKHINLWLKDLNLTIPDEDLYEVVHGVGTASLHLFYRVFLELKDKTQLDFLTDNEINSQLGNKLSRFHVIKVDTNEYPNKIDLHYEGLCEPLLAGGDVYHWYKDRMENLQNRCKEARDEYVHILKTRCRSCGIDHLPGIHESGFVLARSITFSPRPSFANLNPNELPNEDFFYDERTYEELINKQKEAQQLQQITPDHKEVKKIMKTLKLKSIKRRENKLLRNALHQEIMNDFDNKVNESKLKAEDRVLTKIFLRQTCFEKELISKMGQVKMQKEFMIENKFKQGEVLNKLKEKEFVDAIVLQEKDLNEKKLTYYLERERVLQLHKKVWEERIRLRAKRHEIICSNALKDIVDISIKMSDHKARFGQELSKREMNELKHIFVSGQPVFDICDPVVNIIKGQDELEEIEEAEFITLETLRQNALDQEEFDGYMKYDWPWELKNVDISTSEMLEYISCGLNVLGHIVHQVLLTKYPLPPIRERPHFPDAVIRVCVNGLHDVTFIPTLRNLLSEREIEVIELNQSVDFCVQAYQQESKREHDEEELASIKEGKKRKEKPDKLSKKGEKSKHKTKARSEDTEPTLSEVPKEFENKIVQTPLIYPCEEIAYSPQAMLGKTAQEILDQGQPLTDYLLIATFVEYLKSIPRLKGWALINYPTNYEQAAILEEALTGINILKPGKISPDGKSILEIADIEGNSEIGDCTLDRDLEVKRKSRLLPNPVDAQTVKVYDTILTAYIKIRKIPVDEKNGDVILPPVFEELGNEPDPLDKFYSDTGANYSLYYKDFDLTSVKYLGKLIIGDYSLPLKSSVELFGDGINYMDIGSGPPKSLKAAKKGEKVNKPKEKITKSQAASAPEPSEKKTAKGDTGKKGKAKVIIIHEDKYTQIPTEDEDEVEEIYVSQDTIQIPTAGQEGWHYTIVPCPEELMIALATLWETIEEIYMNDLKQVFFLKRLNMNSVMPYVQYVKDIMKKVIDRPDYKGFYLERFQKAFNVFDMDFRKDDEFKAEMYCRIEDFKEKLAELCDEKMMNSEDARCKIINGNWTTNQITELFNDYVIMFQIEMDRFTESIRFINDYYMGVFTGKPSEEELWKEDSISKISDISPEIVNFTLQRIDSAVDLSFFEHLLSNMIHKITSCIKKFSTNTSNNMDKIKFVQTTNTPKSKATTPKSNDSKDVKKSTGPEVDIVKENLSKLMEEWHCAVKGESLRVSLRIELLKYNALQTMQHFLEAIRSCFHKIYNDIRSKYEKEMENTQNACKIFHAAVENEKPVQKELIFVDHTFYINPEVNLFENAPLVPDLPKETVEEGAFTVEQLSKISDILMDLCPSGYILRASFIFFLQDIIWNSPEDGSESMAPNLWKKLDPFGLRKVIDELYDDLEYVYWRDFIVYNLRISFPTERELLLTRQNLRECDPDATELVEDYQFYGTKIWFDYSYKSEDAAKLKGAKQLLRKLYYVKNYGINYTALLLDFCKDDNILTGFGKALELCLGKIVCWNSDMGNFFKEEFLKKVQDHEENVRLRDKERAEYYKIAYDEVCKLVNYVVHISEDVIIEDYIEEQQKIKEPVDKKIIKNKNETEKPRRNSILKKSIDVRNGRRNSKGEDIKFKNVVESEANLAKDQKKPSVSKSNTEEDKSNAEEDKSNTEEDPGKTEDLKSGESLIMKLYKNLPDNVYTDATDYTQLVLFLPFDVILTVITAALPWHCRVQMYEELSLWEQAAEIYENKRNPNFNMSVLAHEFLNSNEFLNLLVKTKKFKAMDPVRIVKNVIGSK